MEGTIKRLVRERGFGFIKASNGSGEFFFHRSSCVGTPYESLREGQHVTFEIEPSDKGPRAKDVEAQ